MSESKNKIVHVKCKASASLLPNNLASNANYLAYIHCNEVHLVKNSHALLSVGKASSSSSTKSAFAEKDPISQIKFCRLSMGEVLVLITSGGLVHIYDESGQKLLLMHKLFKSQVALSAKDAYLRGIADDGKTSLYVGSGSGEILSFSLSGKKIALSKKLAGHKEAVTDVALCNKSGIMASGDTNGNIILWTSGANGFTRGTEFKGQGEPVTSLQIAHGYIVAGFASGHLRYFSTSGTPELKVEIAAHTRAISAIAVHPTAQTVVAVAEDSFVSAWTLPSSGQVKNILSRSINTSLLAGVQFCGKDNSLFAATSYDSRFISILPQPK